MSDEEDAFEALLEEALQLLEANAKGEAVDDARLAGLLDTLRPVASAPDAPDPLRGRLDRLNQHLAAVEKARAEGRDRPDSHWPVGGVFPG